MKTNTINKALTLGEIIFLLKKSPILLTALLNHNKLNYNQSDELGRVSHINREYLHLKIGIREHRKDYFYLLDHNAYLIIERVVTNTGETKKYFGEWRLKRPVIG